MILVLVVAPGIASAQPVETNTGVITFTTLHTFSGTDGYNPMGALVQATNGEMYGVTAYCLPGISSPCGTAFKITPSGVLTTLYDFCSQQNCSDGDGPSGLVETASGELYGTASGGGAYNHGTIFRLSPTGALTTLYSFCGQAGCLDGSAIAAALVQGADGNFYGTTAQGGANCAPSGCGTIFKITPSGLLTTLYNFCAQPACADGKGPTSPLIQGADGDLYGTTPHGGNTACVPNGCGTVFKITLDGKLTTLHRFCSQSHCADGIQPVAALVQAKDGDLYGTTNLGGVPTMCPFGCGTVFKITPKGTFTTIYDFCVQANCTDGELPNGALVQVANGDLYGTTEDGPMSDPNVFATIFKITPSGTFTTIYNLPTGCASSPIQTSWLVQATDGTFYDSTPGGCNNYGTIFRLSDGLGPFVKTLPAAGKVGEAVAILGYNLTGATSVTFNGVPAKFKVDAATAITAQVPEGATTGRVAVTMPSATLTSNVAFLVAP